MAEAEEDFKEALMKACIVTGFVTLVIGILIYWFIYYLCIGRKLVQAQNQLVPAHGVA